jgi:DNA polymerase/3'-5' exonuclease PolX
MSLHQAAAYAEERLRPWCDHLEIAGSIRRGVQLPRDIEIVCVPTVIAYREFRRAVDEWRKIKGGSDGKYTRRRLPHGHELDLFICSPSTFPVNLMIRTGCADFSREMVTRAQKLGMRCEGARLYGVDGRALELKSEQDVFSVLRVPFVKPKDRTPEVAARLAKLEPAARR